MQNLNFRRVCDRDMKEVIELLQEISEYLPDIESYESVRESFFSQGNVYGLVAHYEPDSRVVGYGCLIIASNFRGGNVGYIEDIVVEKAFRRKGIGKSIINNLINIAIAQNCYKLTLESNPQAVNFYSCLGFKEGGVTMKKLLNGK